MEIKSIAEQPLPVPKQLDYPYPPSWVDRFQQWVNRLPAPPWTFYLFLWLAFILIESASKWLDGVEASFHVRWIYILYSFYGIYFLGAIHYLDAWAKTAFAKFRPALAFPDSEGSRLSYELTTMPARTVGLLTAASLVSVILLIRPLIIPLW